MTRTGTLAFSRATVLAMLLGGTGVAQAQDLIQHTPPNAGWQASDASDRAPTFRRADSSATSWQPTRSTVMPSQIDETPPAPKPPKNWLTPTQAAGRKKLKQAKTNQNDAGQTAARVPNPFVPPADAEQLTAATKPPAQSQAAGKVKRPVRSMAVSPRRPSDSYSAGSRPSQSAARTNNKSANSDYATQQPQLVRREQSRVAHRPRPSTTAGRTFDDSWIRPLKQAAYQASEPEELYAPPGDASAAPMQGEHMQGEPTGPEMPPDGEWIGSPEGVPNGDSCSDGECGPDGAPNCGDDVGCCSTCGRGPEACSIDLALGLQDPEACEEVRFRIPRIHTLMVNGGVHGFKGPYDQARDSGNFGFQEGFNLGFKVPLTDFGYQLGYQSTQSQLSGDSNTGITNGFSQHFVTAGVFRRNRDGFQGGIAWDLLLDERETNVSFSQLRGEFGFVDCGCHEVGASIAVHLRDHTFSELEGEALVTTTFQSADQYLLYYRMHGCRGGEGRVYAGLTDDTDGLIGADFLLPLTDCWSLQPAFTYLIPSGGGSSSAASEEAWNIGINLVWHWKDQAHSCHSSPYRPLFNVADNGYMIIDRRP